MFRKSVILVFAVLVILTMQNASAFSWGKINATSDIGVGYVERYGQLQATLTVSYQAYFFGYLPIFVNVDITDSPSWLTVIASTPTFTLKPGESRPINIIMQVSQNDVRAGTSGKVSIELSGHLITGGALRQIDSTKVEILVGYNPFTEIGIRAVKPIERTAPDRELPFSFDIINYGNTRVVVSLTPAKQPPEGWKYVISPSTVYIEPKKEGEDTYPYSTVTVTVTTPHGPVISYSNEWQNFAITAKAVSEAPYFVKQGNTWTRTNTEMELVNVNEVTQYFLAKNRGFYVPGFDAISVIAGIALLSFIVLKKKK